MSPDPKQEALNWPFDNWVYLIQLYIERSDHLTSRRQWTQRNQLHKSVNRFYVSFVMGRYMSEIEYQNFGGVAGLEIARSDAQGTQGRA